MNFDWIPSGTTSRERLARFDRLRATRLLVSAEHRQSTHKHERRRRRKRIKLGTKKRSPVSRIRLIRLLLATGNGDAGRWTLAKDNPPSSDLKKNPTTTTHFSEKQGAAQRSENTHKMDGNRRRRRDRPATPLDIRHAHNRRLFLLFLRK